MAALAGALFVAVPSAQDVRSPATFSVEGCVNGPGAFAWTAEMTVEKGIALAGGYARSGEGPATISNVSIRRMVEKKLVTIRPKADTPVLENDRISVSTPR